VQYWTNIEPILFATRDILLKVLSHLKRVATLPSESYLLYGPNVTITPCILFLLVLICDTNQDVTSAEPTSEQTSEFPGYTLTSVPSDGNCMFHSLNHQPGFPIINRLLLACVKSYVPT